MWGAYALSDLHPKVQSDGPPTSKPSSVAQTQPTPCVSVGRDFNGEMKDSCNKKAPSTRRILGILLEKAGRSGHDPATLGVAILRSIR